MIFIIHVPMSTLDKLCFVDIPDKHVNIFNNFSKFQIIGKSEKIEFSSGLKKKYKKTISECILPSTFFSHYAWRKNLPQFDNPSYIASAQNHYQRYSQFMYCTKHALSLNDEYYDLLLEFWKTTIEVVPKKETYTQKTNRENELNYLNIMKKENYLNDILIQELIM